MKRLGSGSKYMYLNPQHSCCVGMTSDNKFFVPLPAGNRQIRVREREQAAGGQQVRPDQQEGKPNTLLISSLVNPDPEILHGSGIIWSGSGVCFF